MQELAKEKWGKLKKNQERKIKREIREIKIRK